MHSGQHTPWGHKPRGHSHHAQLFKPPREAPYFESEKCWWSSLKDFLSWGRRTADLACDRCVPPLHLSLPLFHCSGRGRMPGTCWSRFPIYKCKNSSHHGSQHLPSVGLSSVCHANQLCKQDWQPDMLANTGRPLA